VASKSTAEQLARLPTGIPGLDAVTEGGLPLGRSTLLVGPAGAGKTVLATQFLAAGIERFDQGGVLVTFDETTGSSCCAMRRSGARSDGRRTLEEVSTS
jgi:circadian clock protein KaiC